MYAVVDIDAFNPAIGMSYPPLHFAKYGVFCWIYDGGYRGPVHWINWIKTQIEQDWPKVKPKGYGYYWYPNVFGRIQILPTINTDAADAYINSVAVNLLTGKGIPIAP